MRVRTTRIIIERETVTLIRREGVKRAWCPLCAEEVDAIAWADLLQMVVDGHLARGIASGRIHVIGQADPFTRVCLASLLRCLEPEPNFPKETL